MLFCVCVFIYLFIPSFLSYFIFCFIIYLFFIFFYSFFLGGGGGAMGMGSFVALFNAGFALHMKGR